MQTLKDVKDALKDIPDYELEGMFFGLGENSEDSVCLIALEGGAISEKQIGYPGVFDKYPKLTELSKLIDNVKKAQKILDKDLREDLLEDLSQEGITDTYFDEKKKA